MAKRKGMKRSPLKKKSNSETAKLKDEIQALLREVVMKRDGGCILRDIRHCGAILGSGAILQADHLITRANSATYADSRLVVCVCKGCHAWKHLGHREKEYEALIKPLIGKERADLWNRCEQDRWRPSKHGAYEWKLAKLALEQELKNLS